MYESRAKALKSNPRWLTANDMMNLIEMVYGFRINPTNIGVISIHNKLPTIDFVRFMDGKFPKVGHLYDPDDLELYAYFSLMLAVNRRMSLSCQTIAKIEELDDRLVDKFTRITHVHHKVPKHAGGTNDTSNLEELTVFEHANAHRALYEKHGRFADLWAWRKLLSLCIKRKN